MRVGSLTSAMHAGLNGIDRGVARVESAADSVAAGVRDAEGDFSRSLADLPQIRRHLRANIAVVQSADTLLRQLSSLRRR